MKKNVKSYIKKAYSEEINDILNLISSIAENEEVKVYLVGGMVRDLLLDNPSVDLDITVENISGIDFAKKLASHYDTEPNIYPKFKTATVFFHQGTKIDVATCRKEIYPKPGTLPEVKVGSIKEDLFRRDFTINAMAISLNKEDFGEVLDFYGGIKDLKSKLLRVLHENSFIDDPTRMLRLVRFVARLGFSVEENTREYLKEGGLDIISEDRVWNELRLMLEEEDFNSQIQLFDKYIGLDFIHPSLKIKKIPFFLFEEAKENFNKFQQADIKEIHNIDCKYWIMTFMILTQGLKKGEIEEVCERYNFSKKAREKVLKYKDKKQDIAKFFQQADELKPSEVYSYLKSFPIESIFIIISDCKKIDIRRKIWYFLTESQFVNLYINGEDLKKMGISPGPEMKHMLKKALYAKIDGELHNKKSELNFIKNKL